MADTSSGSPYHRQIATHNANECDLVESSMELWGREARVLASGLCVQAYPDFHKTSSAYSFGSDIPPRKKFGFIGRNPVLREVVWEEGMPGVQTRMGGMYACIPILWVQR